MRAFLGISIPEKLKPAILSVQRKFSGFDIKFVEPGNLHFNLKFFGNIGDDELVKLKAVLEGVCKQFKPFEIRIAGLGAFPSKNHIRVVWTGVKEGHREMVSLAKLIQDSIRPLGFEEDDFVPHVTLGRVRSGRNKEGIAILLEDMKDVDIGTMKVNRIVLFQSKLGPDGPLYGEVFSVDF